MDSTYGQFWFKSTIWFFHVLWHSFMASFVHNMVVFKYDTFHQRSSHLFLVKPTARGGGGVNINFKQVAHTTIPKIDPSTHFKARRWCSEPPTLWHFPSCSHMQKNDLNFDLNWSLKAHLHCANVLPKFVLVLIDPFVEVAVFHRPTQTTLSNWGPLHTQDWEPVFITHQALLLVEKTELVQVRFTLRLRDWQSMWMQDGCKFLHGTQVDHASWPLGLFSKITYRR
jgi:hypothetical protein